MTKRLHVLLDEVDFRAIEQLAERDGLTTSEWARRHLRESATGERRDSASKLAAIRAAYLHQAPAPDIELMLDEIGRGYANSTDAPPASTG